MSKRYKRKDRVNYANRLNISYNGKLEIKKVKRTKREIFMFVLAVVFLIITSPYIILLLILVWVTWSYDIQWLHKAVNNYINVFDKFK